MQDMLHQGVISYYEGHSIKSGTNAPPCLMAVRNPWVIVVMKGGLVFEVWNEILFESVHSFKSY